MLQVTSCPLHLIQKVPSLCVLHGCVTVCFPPWGRMGAQPPVCSTPPQGPTSTCMLDHDPFGSLVQTHACHMFRAWAIVYVIFTLPSSRTSANIFVTHAIWTCQFCHLTCIMSVTPEHTMANTFTSYTNVFIRNQNLTSCTDDLNRNQNLTPPPVSINLDI